MLQGQHGRDGLCDQCVQCSRYPLFVHPKPLFCDSFMLQWLTNNFLNHVFLKYPNNTSSFLLSKHWPFLLPLHLPHLFLIHTKLPNQHLSQSSFKSLHNLTASRAALIKMKELKFWVNVDLRFATITHFCSDHATLSQLVLACSEMVQF